MLIRVAILLEVSLTPDLSLAESETALPATTEDLDQHLISEEQCAYHAEEV